MYQSVSIASCCRPVDWPPALMAQMLNQPAFLIVPSGFSRISVSFRGSSDEAPWACAETLASRTPPTAVAFSSRIAFALPDRVAVRAHPFLARGRAGSVSGRLARINKRRYVSSNVIHRASRLSSGRITVPVQMQPHHDVLVVVAEPFAEDVDPAGMRASPVDADAQPDRMVLRQVEISERDFGNAHTVDEGADARCAKPSAGRTASPSASTSAACRRRACRRSRRATSRCRPGRRSPTG